VILLLTYLPKAVNQHARSNEFIGAAYTHGAELVHKGALLLWLQSPQSVTLLVQELSCAAMTLSLADTVPGYAEAVSYLGMLVLNWMICVHDCNMLPLDVLARQFSMHANGRPPLPVTLLNCCT